MTVKRCPRCDGEMRWDDVEFGICWRCGTPFEEGKSTGKDNVGTSATEHPFDRLGADKRDAPAPLATAGGLDDLTRRPPNE